MKVSVTQLFIMIYPVCGANEALEDIKGLEPKPETKSTRTSAEGEEAYWWSNRRKRQATLEEEEEEDYQQKLE